MFRILATIVFSLFLVSTLICASAESKQDFFEGTKAQDGFVSLIYSSKQDKIYLHLEKSLLNQEILFQSSLPQGIGSNDIGLDRGQLGDTRIVRFERYGNKILLKELNTKYRAISDSESEKASIDEAFADSVIAGFVIENEDEKRIAFDYTQFLQSDIHGISERLARRSQGSYKIDKSRSGVYLQRTKAFPRNTELETVVTFTGKATGRYIVDVTPDPSSISVHLHHSFIALPDAEYKPRTFHPFSGFWKHSYYDYSVPIEQGLEQGFIPRHRLQKKNPQAEKSEAVEPIVYYLDPGIPEPVMSALKDGALWWDQAFEAAGYVNAFQVKVLPEDADPMDIRYNVIQWVHRATRGWSYGSSVIDPRTGEILKGHVTLGSLRVRQDFLIATGFTAPYQSPNQNDTSKERDMALARIRQLSAHEVGHTLGIAHNFAASEYNRASVMDYPHPMITLENAKINLQGAYDDKIGPWDKYVVEYGYQDFPDVVNEQEALQAIVLSAKEKGYRYKSDPDARIPKRASSDGHLWDNGKDPIEEFKRVSALREFALKNFGANNLPSGEAYSDLERRLVPVFYSHRYQLDALVKQISGIKYEYAVKPSLSSSQVAYVSAERQKEAISLLLNAASPESLTLPTEIVNLIPPQAYGSSRSRESMPSRMGIAFDPITAAESISAHSVNILLASERLNRLAYQASINEEIPSIKFLSEALFDTLIKNNQENALHQRIKLVALSAYFTALKDSNLSPDVKLDMQAVLLDYESWLNKYERKLSNKALLKHLRLYWQTNEWGLAVPIKALPPGSPI